MALRDAGAEVIYLGLRRTVAEIVQAAVDEDADVIGISVLSGRAPRPGRATCCERDAQRGLEDVPVVLGGTIPAGDVDGAARARRRGASSRWAPSCADVVDGILGLGRTTGSGVRRDARRDRSRPTPAYPSPRSTPPTTSRVAGRPRRRLGLPGRAAVHPRAVPVDVPRAAVDDAPVRRVRFAGGDERALPLPAGARADGAVGRVRPADAARLRLGAPDGARRGGTGGRRDRHRRRHGRPVRRAAAGRRCR